MAWYFVRLKATLLAAAFRRSPQHALGLVVGTVLAVPASLAAFRALRALGRGAWLGGDAALVLLVLLVAVWAIGPLVFFGLDETLDPARLRLLPLSRRQLATGMLAAGAVGIGPAVTAIALAGAVAGFAPRGPAALITLLAAALHFVLCVLAGRALTTVLSARLRSRRGRDVAAMLAVLAGFLVAGLVQLPGLLAGTLERSADPAGIVRAVARTLALLPPAWPANALLASAEGRITSALGWLAAGAGLVGGLAWWWARQLERVLVTAPPQGDTTPDDRDLLPTILRPLGRGRLAAAAAKELRYQLRVPQLRAQWVIYPLIAAFAVGGAYVTGIERPAIVLLASAFAGLAGFGALNVFGSDGPAAWLLVATGGPLRADLAGKSIASAVLTLPVVAATAVGLAVVTGGWTFVPLAVLAGIGLLGIAYAVGLVTSVLAPFPLPESPVNMWSGASGMGCATALIQAAAMLAAGVLLAPLGVAAVALSVVAPPLLAVLPAAGAVYGLGLWWAGLHLAAHIVANRGPELVAALSGKR